MSTSRSLNKVMLIGNLTRDPELRKTANGSLVCTFGLATNTSWRDSSGNIQERTEFHNIVCWNKLAEICSQLLSVSMGVFIEGELRTRSWEDDNAIRHYKTEIKALDMKLLDSKGKQGVGMDEAMQDNYNSDDNESEELDSEKNNESEDEDADNDKKKTSFNVKEKAEIENSDEDNDNDNDNDNEEKQKSNDDDNKEKLSGDDLF